MGIRSTIRPFGPDMLLQHMFQFTFGGGTGDFRAATFFFTSFQGATYVLMACQRGTIFYPLGWGDNSFSLYFRGLNSHFILN